MIKRILALALMGAALAMAAHAAPAPGGPVAFAQGYGVPTYGYAAQYYAPPRPPCCLQAPPPCCVQAPPPCCARAAPPPPSFAPCSTCAGYLTLGPAFTYDGGVGPIPEGGYGGGGYVYMGGGSGAGSAAGAGATSSSRASASASASASSAVSIRIGGGGHWGGGHGGGKPGCGGCGH